MTRLEVRDLVVAYGRGGHAVTAVDHVSLRLDAGAILGVVGESGSGKSTLARAVAGLVPVTSGEISLDGDPINAANGRPARAMRARRRKVQMVFQDPYASLDPRRSVGASVAEGLAASGKPHGGHSRGEVMELLELVRLDPGCYSLLPRDLSGGQRQRVALARALAARPRVLIADEITSALDVSVQGAVLNLLRDVQRETGVSVLFISHNLAVVRYMADTVAVMHDGRVTETGPTDEVTLRPREPYTQQLIASIPSVTDGTGHG